MLSVVKFAIPLTDTGKLRDRKESLVPAVYDSDEGGFEALTIIVENWLRIRITSRTCSASYY